MTEGDVAGRIGIARSTLQLIEKGQPRVEIGLALEAAALLGVPLFVDEPSQLAPETACLNNKLALLPQSVRRPRWETATTFEADARLPVPTEAFVWIQLPGAFVPVIAGRIERDGRNHVLTCGRLYLERERAMALTMLGLTELQAHYASFVDLSQIVRARFVAPRETLRELFARMVFNILIGNTDDHARHHKALCDGETLTLTPAYDIYPQGRNGREANQAMAVLGDDRRSLLEHCRLSAPSFLLSDVEARDIINS